MSIRWRSAHKSPFGLPITKYRVYVDSEDEVPEGYQVQYGQRGGIFYEVESGAEEGEPHPDVDDGEDVDWEGFYHVDTEFGRRVADAVTEGTVVSSIAANEWMSLAGEIEDERLLVDSLKQIVEDEGTKTARERVRRRLRGLGWTDGEIDDALGELRESEPTGEMWDVEQAIERIEPLYFHSHENTHYSDNDFELFEEAWERAPTEAFEQIYEQQFEMPTGIDAVHTLYDIVADMGEPLRPTDAQTNAMAVVDDWLADTITEEEAIIQAETVIEQFGDELGIGSDMDSLGRVAATALYYRDDGPDIEIDEVLGIDAPEDYVPNEDWAAEKWYQAKEGVEKSLDKLDPTIGIWAMAQLEEVRWDEMRDAAGRYNRSGRIKLHPMGSNSQTMAHEFGHHVHYALGLDKEFGTYPDDWREFDRDESVWGMQEPTDDRARELYQEVSEHWDRYANRLTGEIRTYQRRHGVEFLAVTFAHWVDDTHKLNGRDPHMKQFWDINAGTGERVESYEDVQEGDEIILHNESQGMFPSAYEVIERPEDPDDPTQIWVLEEKLYRGGMRVEEMGEDIHEFFQQGVHHD